MPAVAACRQWERLDEISQLLGIAVNSYGFDSGAGLPRPTDARDLPNLYEFGDYRMDEAALRARLTEATLHLGPINETLPGFLQELEFPIGFISIDVDLYSSTVDAFSLLDAPDDRIFRRVYLYEDSLGLTFSDFNGERLALQSIAAAGEGRKTDLIHGLQFDLPWPLSAAKWPHMMYMLHCFEHEHYARKDNLIATPHAPAVMARSAEA